jgi:hypothetical protein
MGPDEPVVSRSIYWRQQKRMNTGSHTSVTTTTFLLGRSAGHALSQLSPSTLELVVPLIAFAVIATIMGVVLVRRRFSSTRFPRTRVTSCS